MSFKELYKLRSLVPLQSHSTLLQAKAFTNACCNPFVNIHGSSPYPLLLANLPAPVRPEPLPTPTHLSTRAVQRCQHQSSPFPLGL